MDIDVLFIDDNAYCCDFVRRMLQRRGIHCITTTNARDGIHYAVENVPRLILTDLYMKPISGYEVLATLKLIPALKQVPIIALTASVTAETKNICREMGFDDFYGKPILRKELEKLVATYLVSFRKPCGFG
jgi:CheY-like chemotaxis protein